MIRTTTGVSLAAVLFVACAGCGGPQPSSSKPAGATAPVPHINTVPAQSPAPDRMAWIPGGTFWMGCDNCEMQDALPMHLVTVDPFWMDETPVTNAEFERFVAATGYVTVAERPLNPADFPGAPRDKLVSGSVVFFKPGTQPPTLTDPSQWWRYAQGANWKHPEGPGSTLKGRERHPVVHIAYEDAVAYGTWSGKRLPTEAEYEFAARGGLDRQLYAWGNEMTPGNKPMANTWQGSFPTDDRGADGYLGTSPVTAFPPNGFGLYDVGGNVWQWCSDWYRPDAYTTSRSDNPQGPADSYDPQEPGAMKRVVRGGSYLCSEHFCSRYLVGSRGKAEVSTGTSNLGFRLVRSAPAHGGG
jgi:sulfatase modifying factor 1